MDKRRHRVALLAILQHYAPDGEAQRKCSDSMNQAILDGATDDQVTLMLAGAIVDGLRSGNWPWTSYTLPKE